MKIYGSTEYVDYSKQKEPWYQLEVINQWDWKTKAICSKKTESLINNVTIYYFLKKCTATSSNTSSFEIINTLTEEMKEELLRQNYIIM